MLIQNSAHCQNSVDCSFVCPASALLLWSFYGSNSFLNVNCCYIFAEENFFVNLLLDIMVNSFQWPLCCIWLWNAATRGQGVHYSTSQQRPSVKNIQSKNSGNLGNAWNTQAEKHIFLVTNFCYLSRCMATEFLNKLIELCGRNLGFLNVCFIEFFWIGFCMFPVCSEGTSGLYCRYVYRVNQIEIPQHENQCENIFAPTFSHLFSTQYFASLLNFATFS